MSLLPPHLIPQGVCHIQQLETVDEYHGERGGASKLHLFHHHAKVYDHLRGNHSLGSTLHLRFPNARGGIHYRTDWTISYGWRKYKKKPKPVKRATNETFLYSFWQFGLCIYYWLGSSCWILQWINKTTTLFPSLSVCIGTLSAVVRCWKLKVFTVQREVKVSHTLSAASWWKLFLSSPTQLALKHWDVERFKQFNCKYREHVNKGLITSWLSCMSPPFHHLWAVFVTCEESFVVIWGSLRTTLTGNFWLCQVGSDDSNAVNDACNSITSYWVRSSWRKVPVNTTYYYEGSREGNVATCWSCWILHQISNQNDHKYVFQMIQIMHALHFNKHKCFFWGPAFKLNYIVFPHEVFFFFFFLINSSYSVNVPSIKNVHYCLNPHPCVGMRQQRMDGLLF